MKANEAPEKLYISDSELNDAEHCVIWFKSQQNEKGIEYTRTDAFIEKACDAYCKMCDTKECGDTGECEWVLKFRKRLIK